MNVGVGVVNDAFGPGDGQSLKITFDERDRVRETTLSPP